MAKREPQIGDVWADKYPHMREKARKVKLFRDLGGERWRAEVWERGKNTGRATDVSRKTLHNGFAFVDESEPSANVIPPPKPRLSR